MIREYLSNHSILPIIGMFLFLLSFVYLTYSALFLGKKESEEYSRLPLEEEKPKSSNQTLGENKNG